MYEEYRGLTVEEFLRTKMVEDFGSVKKFSEAAGVPYSTMTSALKRGFDTMTRANSNKVLDTLGVSTAVIDFWDPLEPLPEEIQKKEEEIELNERDKREITKVLSDTREHLMEQEGLMFDGEPASEEGVQAILDALEIGLEIAKKRNKEKYTPKKYRK
ncbi:hypothetical protein [Eubacterium limosum]|uniref:hypothetical protein n=1 Tax=Eubacterium limosum TaxID=1736 RepID=UPI003720241F